MNMNPPLNDHTAKLLMYHVHKIGLALSAFETEVFGSAAMNQSMRTAIEYLREGLGKAQQEIIDLRDGKS